MVIDEKFEMIEDYKTEQRELLEPLLKYNFNANRNGIFYNVPFVYKNAFTVLSIILILIFTFGKLF